MYVHSVQWRPDLRERAPVRVNPVRRHPDERVMSLDGPWRFRLDPEDRGRREGWFTRPDTFSETVRVPGCWQGQGFGHDGTDTPWDFQLPARVFRATYQGTGWYAKTFKLPPDWRGARIWLNFGGVHPAAEIWLNGNRVGGHSAPFVPFGFEATRHLKPKGENELVVRVFEHNRWLGLAYNWMGNWSGLYRGVELVATGNSWLEHFHIYPDLDERRIRCRVHSGGGGRGALSLSISLTGPDGAPIAQIQRSVTGKDVRTFSLAVPSPQPWSPDAPHLYRVDAVLSRDGRAEDALSERAGFLKLGAANKHFLINDEPYYMRGTGDFLAHPETGSPDTDRDRWRRKLTALRVYGYNYVRCQSYVPAPEYFDVADEVGLLVQSEMGMLGAWSGINPWRVYSWPRPTIRFRDALKWQWDRTVLRDVNHPSAAIYCMSNELGSRGCLFPRTAWQCCRDTKAIKPSAFVIWTDGGLDSSLPQDFVNDEAAKDKTTPLPLIQHEYRWWSAYPDVRIRRKYRGAVRPYAIEKAEEAARRHGLERLLPRMAKASHHLQYIEARTKMEACRRDHPRLAGISHFNAMDIGYSPQGIVDEFYDRKLVSASVWRRTNGDTVVLMGRDFDTRVLTGGEKFTCRISVSDFSHPPFSSPEIEWELAAGNRRYAAGAIQYRHRPFRTCRAGKIAAVLPAVAAPVMLTLRTMLREGDRSVGNEWNFWLFPEDISLPKIFAIYGGRAESWLRTIRPAQVIPTGRSAARLPRVVLSDRFDERLANHCRQGGRLILAAPEEWRRPFRAKLGVQDAYFFLPPANYPPLEDGHSGTIIRDHPMLGKFPHEGFADMQFYRLIRPAAPIFLEALGLEAEDPILRVLSTYYVVESLAYLAEVSLGRGGIIVCALDLDQRFPEARYLLKRMLQYAASNAFRPRARLSERVLARLLRSESR